jgi:hypothetical protein
VWENLETENKVGLEDGVGLARAELTENGTFGRDFRNEAMSHGLAKGRKFQVKGRAGEKVEKVSIAL